MKAIVLCGGLGTRLGALTREMPKPLIEVAGRPFLERVLDQLLRGGGIDEIVLAVSFHWEKIRAAIGHEWRGVKVSYSVEAVPLGTGGAIRQALEHTGATEAIVLNGDTLLKFEAHELATFAREHDAQIALALTSVPDAGRFGRVQIGTDHRVASFEEKGAPVPGSINAGMYYVRADAFADVGASAFSFEQDVMKAGLARVRIYGLQTQAWFIDMGIPADLERARQELAR